MINKRIITYSKKTKKPIITHPINNIWVNTNSNIEWYFNDLNIQEKFIIEVSNLKDFPVLNTWHYEEASSRNYFNINEHPSVWEIISQTGVYFFRIKVKGIVREEFSDWSDVGVLQIDLGVPNGVGIDLINLITSNDGEDVIYLGESHSNTFTYSFAKEKDLGFYLGNNFSNKILHIVNDTAGIKTFYGQILNNEEFTGSFNEKIKILTTQNKERYFIRNGTIKVLDKNVNGIQFVFSLNINETITLLYDNANIQNIKYDLRIVDGNHLSHIDNIPQDSSSEEHINFFSRNFSNIPTQYSRDLMKKLIYIGPCKTPVLQFNFNQDYSFNILEMPNLDIQIGKTLINNKLNNNYHEIDNSVIDATIGSRISISKNNSVLKSGDYIKFQSNFNAYSSNPHGILENSEGNNYFIDPYKFDNQNYHIRNSKYKISDLINQDSHYELHLEPEANFPFMVCNKKYNRIGAPINGINAISSSLDIIKDKDNKVIKTRYLTTIICNEEISRNITNPTTLSPLGDNGISERWLAIKPIEQDKFLFYPIIYSKNNTITIASNKALVDDFNSLNWNINSDLDFYICGDTFTPCLNTAIINTNNLYAYIKFESAKSPITEIGYTLNRYKIIDDTDIFNNTLSYVEREINNDVFNNMHWQKISTTDFNKNFIKLDLDIDIDSSYIYELISDGKNATGNTSSNGDFQKTISACFKPYNFYFAIKDNANINVDDSFLRINNNEKHAISKNIVVDLYNILDNYKIDYFRVSEFNPFALTETDSSKPLISNQNMYNYIYSPCLYWKQWKVGANYRLRANINENQKPLIVQEEGINYFKLFIKRTIPTEYIIKENEIFLTDLKDVRFDLIGSFLSLNNSTLSYPIIGIETSETLTNQDIPSSQFDYTYYDILVLLGKPDSSIKNNSEFTINTSLTWPNKNFIENGFFVTHKAINNSTNSTNENYDLISIDIDEKIDYINGSKLLSNIDFSNYKDTPTIIQSEWNGWFWTEYDAEYIFDIQCAHNDVSVFFENKEFNRNNSSSKADQINKGSYQPWRMDVSKISNKQSLPIRYNLSSNGSLAKSTYIKKFNRGWNKIAIVTECDLDQTTLKPKGEISLQYRSAINDSMYNAKDWKLPILDYTSINVLENSCELIFNDSSLKYNTNSLKNKKCLVKLLNAKTGSYLINANDSVNEYKNYTSDRGDLKSFVLNDNSLFLDSDNIYFIQRSGDYNIFPIHFGDFELNETLPYNRIPFLANNDETDILNYLDSNTSYEKSYKIGEYNLKIINNNENKVYFKPVINGIVKTINRLNDKFIKIIDSDQSWKINELIGLPIKIGNNIYKILSNDSNSITILFNSDYSILLNLNYRIGCIKDIFQSPNENIFIYIPIGQHKQLISEDNVVRNAAKIYVDAYDISNNNVVFSKAISLKGVDVDNDNESYTGSIIEIDTISQKIISLFNISGQVYDANEVEQVIGVYESNPISSPTGFAYWKTLTWTEYTPEGTEVEFYIKTAESEAELVGREYNIDAFNRFYDPFTSSSFNVPKFGVPTAIDISNFSTDGTKTSFNEIRRFKWLQFKVVLKSKKTNITPSVGNIKITYTTSEESIIPIVNQKLKGNIIRGFLSVNMEIPEGTNIIWGINTSNDTDFNKYQIIPVNEAFEVLEPQKQFRIAAKLISSGSATPKIFSATFLYDSDGESDLLNEKL